jgi:hypothetical protein
MAIEKQTSNLTAHTISSDKNSQAIITQLGESANNTSCGKNLNATNNNDKSGIANTSGGNFEMP